jgi:hypothetical protein
LAGLGSQCVLDRVAVTKPTRPTKLEYGRRLIFFHWSGFDEGDAVGGDGSAELQDDGSLEIELSFDDGDDAILTAYREMTFFKSMLRVNQVSSNSRVRPRRVGGRISALN